MMLYVYTATLILGKQHFRCDIYGNIFFGDLFVIEEIYTVAV